ncbi:MAG: phage tail tape measure protein [Thermoplasmata archaeon]|nr:phage tail tape measure protein [Thermoplasmata archaeon]
MAKSSGKSTKKSGNTKNASTKAEKEAEKDTSTKVSEGQTTASKKSTTALSNKKIVSSKKEIKKASSKEKEVKEAKPKKATAKKESTLKCKFCQKTIKDQKTLKIHERNCQTKKDQQTEKKLKASMLKMKDDFEDQQQSIVKQFQKREDALQNELDEMRTVLRMELDKHRKELEMIRKVEKQVAEVVRKQPELAHESGEELIHMMDGQPRAIDMIPIPLPNIPKKKIEPVPMEIEEFSSNIEPKIEHLPVIELKEEHPPVPEANVESVTEIHPGPVSIPEPVPTITGLSKEEIEELVKSLLKVSSNGVPDLEELKTKNRQISGRLDALDSKLDRFDTDIENKLDKIGKKSNLRNLEKELNKVSDRVLDMMEEIGFGENLSVTKIPPTILEIVYQATLDDIHFEIVRTKGAQDAETIARAALEEVRLKTSGSELFMFDGRKIVTDNLARSIGANMISAKQIQTTYDVLLDRLLETLPHHKAKNFQGMIKVKSQEFAVDRATVLSNKYNHLEKVMESTSQMVAAISAQANARNLEIQETLDDIKNNLLATKASQEDIDLMRIKMQEQDEKDIRLDNELALLKVEIEMREQIRVNEQDEEPAIIVPGETIDVEEIIKDTKEIAEPKPDISPAVLESIQNGASSKTAIIRETGLEEDDILEAIVGLLKDKKVIDKKIGKRTKYLTPEQDLNEKLEADEKKKGVMPSKKVIPRPEDKKSALSMKVIKKEDKKAEKSKDKKPAKKVDVSPPRKTGESLPDKKEPVKKKQTGKKEDKSDSKKAILKKELKTPAKKEEKKKLADKKQKEPPKEEKKASKKDEAEPKKAEKEPEVEQKKEKASPAKDKDKPKEEEKKSASLSKKVISPSKEGKSSSKEDVPKEKHVDDDLPFIIKKLEDLSDDERRVLNIMSEDGMTISGIQSKVGKDMKRFALLRALRVLIDSGYVGIITKGRTGLYQKINVTKMDKMNKNENSKEVK